MSNQKITDQRGQTSRRHRLSLLEEIARDRVVFALGTEAPSLQTGGTWFEATARRVTLTSLVANDPDQTFAKLVTTGVTVNTMQLVAGRYSITMNITAKNDNATAVMGYRFGITDDAATPVAFYASTSVDLSLPASSQNFTANINKPVMVDLTGATNIIYFVHALSVAGTASLVRGISSEIIVQRLG